MGVAGRFWGDAFAFGTLLAESDLITSQLVKKKKFLNNLTREDVLGPFSFSVNQSLSSAGRSSPLGIPVTSWASRTSQRSLDSDRLREEAIH